MEGVYHITMTIVWQGEDRDSSDEEWEAAYAALDPIAQLGWRHHHDSASAVGAHLVRDVFVAADEMHNNAMSEMEGNTFTEGGSEVHGEGTSGREASMSTPTEESDTRLQNMDLDQEGESQICRWFLNTALNVQVIPNR